MSTLIPGDPLLRKTFTYQEQGWHTEHNRNWTETVGQLNDLSDDLGELDTRLSSAESSLTGLGDNLTDLTGDVNDKLSKSAYSGELTARAVTTIRVAALQNDTALEVEATRADVKLGDTLRVSNPETGTSVTVVVSADAAEGVTQIPIDPCPAALGVGQPVVFDERWLRSSFQVLSDGFASHTQRLDTIDDEIVDVKTSLTASDDQIAAFSQRLTTAENTLTTANAKLQLNADGLALAATKTELSTLTGRVSSVESSFTTQAEQISGIVTSMAEYETFSTQSQTQYEQVSDAIALTASRSELLAATAANSVATTTADLDGSLVTSLPVTPITASLNVDDDVVVVASDTLARTTCKVAVPVAVNDTAIEIDLRGVDAPSGSFVFVPTKTMQAQFQIRADEILASVTGSAPEVNTIGTVTSDTSSTSIESIQLDRLATSLTVNDVVTAFDENGQLLRFEVDTNVEKSSGPVTVSVEPLTVTAPVKAGAALQLPVETLMSMIRLNQSEISLRIKSGDEVRTALDASLSGIDIKADAFKSSDWNGTLTGTGPSTTISSPGTKGWALTAGGEVDFTGRFRTSDGSIDITKNKIRVLVPMNGNDPTNYDDYAVVGFGGTNTPFGAFGTIASGPVESWHQEVFGTAPTPGHRQFNVWANSRVDALSVSSERHLNLSAGKNMNLRFVDLRVDALGIIRFLNSKIILNGLPTSNPGVVNQIWNNAGALSVSAG